MSNASEMSRQVDQTYKNLLDKFNPTARQIITAGKAYLKALHSASASSKQYLDTISKLSSQLHQSPTGGSADIGSSLDEIIDVYKEIHSQQSNVLKAFYVDFLVPLEANLDKDVKIIQMDHKRFLSQQKVRQDAVAKAENNVRKQRKKKIGSKTSIDKEIKTFQILDEERANLDTFLDISRREVTTQERRRYSFIFERLCSIGRHHLALHSKGASLLQKHLDGWVSVTSETPSNTQCKSPTFKGEETECIYSTPGEGTAMADECVSSPRRRAQSLDGYLSDGDRRGHEQPYMMRGYQSQQFSDRSMSRAKSDYSLETRDTSESHQSRRSLAISDKNNLARASFSFQATADNQLSFEEGDVIVLIGERNKGWQYGENQRTKDIGWFPVAYTEQLEEGDSAIGCSYSNTPPSSQSKSIYEESKERPSPTYPPSRGHSLDRLDHRTKKQSKLRARSSSNNPSSDSKRALPVQPASFSLDAILREKEKGQNYYSIRPPSSCDSDNKKTFETFNSHLFLTEDMEEDLESYEGSYKEISKQREQNKYTSFGAEHSLSPSLCRSLTSPELPSCFRKSVSSKESLQCSDDSGFSNEENRKARQSQSTSSYSESCSKSIDSSWVTDSYELCGSRNTSEDRYRSCCNEENCSPTFLRYLYPSYKDSESSSRPIRHSSVDALDDPYFLSSKKENWITNRFGTLGKKKKNLVSPCAQKIASQKARKKNVKSSLRRTSSLLCIDMGSCTSSPEEPDASNYEDITYTTWHHVSLVNVKDLPSPPPYDPPPLPTNSNSSINRGLNCAVSPLYPKSSQNHDKSPSRTIESSSGNSSWSESEGSCMEAYMVVKDHKRDNCPESQNDQLDRKCFLTRSYTWASPDAEKSSVAVKHKRMESTQYVDYSPTKLKNIPNHPGVPPPKPSKRKSNCYQPSASKTNHAQKTTYNSQYRANQRNENIAPPLPPRKRAPSTPKKEVNISNYSQYMCQRLTNPNGTYRFDQRSDTTGRKCSIWYDLWGSDPSVGKLV